MRATETAAPTATVTFRRLNPDAPVGLRVEACLPLRSRQDECELCVQACPIGVLHRREETFALDDGCLGCGRCQTACPMGALTVAGFAIGPVAGDGRDALDIDCQRVPADASPAGAVRVPCLGGLAVSRLLALRLLAGDRPMHLLDRGWCARCPAGAGAKHPARATLARARAWLQEAGVPESQWPDLRRRPLPASMRARTLADAGREHPLNRRDFFSRLARQVTGAVSEVMVLERAEPPAAGANARYAAPASSLEREWQFVLLQQLAARPGRFMPARFFPAIEVEENCRNHRLCVALCPTGALRAYDIAGAGGIVLDASACIACGHCEAVCPEEALRLLPQGNGATPRTPMTLTRHALRVCEDCCSEFAGLEDEALCPGCRKSRDFARAGVDALFRRRVD